MKCIQCPETYKEEPALFVAGGISGCADWQSEFVSMLANENITVLNPRRKVFIDNDGELSKEQIKWEFEYLKKASAVSFWFTEETLCPITLYELGKQSMDKKPLFIGVHPNYKRKFDVEFQTKQIRPEIEIVYSLKDLAEQVKNWARGI